MPTGSQDDLQIKAAGTANSSTASQSSAQATQAAAPVSAQPSVGQINLADANQPAPTPVNQRAFKLDSDVEGSSTHTPKPDKYAIPKLVMDKYPDLVELIKVTESMDDAEREYWFQILPVMTEDQIAKFKNILITEKQQLTELDKEYEDELNRLNEKHLIEWKEFETKEKSKSIKEAEAATEAQEKQMEEDLLAKLSDV